MDFRYLGFDQLQNARAYRFDVTEKGGATRHFVITVDLGLFQTYHLGIQEGPSLCAAKLAADLENCPDGMHVLTNEDVRAFADARAAAELRRIEARKGGPRRFKNTPDHSQSPWRGK